MNINVAVLDNDGSFLQVTKEALEKHFSISTTHDTNYFIDNIKEPVIAVIDWYLDYGIVGIDVMRRVREHSPLCHFIFVSSLVSKEILMTVINEGWGCYFIEKAKSDFFDELIGRIKQAKIVLNQKLEAATIAVTNNQKLQKTLEETLKTLDSSNGRTD